MLLWFNKNSAGELASVEWRPVLDFFANFGKKVLSKNKKIFKIIFGNLGSLDECS